MPLENTDAEERITRETMIGWIEHWGESYDDVRPDDGAMRLANRIIEYNAATETIEALRNPDAVYDELASILQPVLSSMDGTYFAGSEWFAGEVDRMEADRINGERPEETDGLASEEPRIPFIVESEATAADTDEPPLDELITAATHEYLDSGMTYDGFSEHVRTTWRNAAAYDWSKLMAEPRSTGEWSSDANRLAVLGVMMQFAPESTCMMIASDILAENAPPIPSGIARTHQYAGRHGEHRPAVFPADRQRHHARSGAHRHGDGDPRPVGGQRADGRLLPDHRPDGHAQPRHGRR